MSNRHLTWGLAATFAVLVGIGASLLLFAPGEIRLKAGTALPTPKPVADFALTGSDGQPYTRAQLGGHWTLLFAGYTYCPDVCPTTLTEMKALRARLGADAARLKVLFVSVDPARDTPERLARYVHYFDPGFDAATGGVPALEALGRNVGFVFNRVEGATPEAYLMDHSAGLILIDPQARVAGYFSPPYDLPALADDLRPLLRKAV